MDEIPEEPVQMMRFKKFEFSGFTEEFKRSVLDSDSVLIPIILGG